MTERKTASPDLSSRPGRNVVGEIDDVRNVVNIEDKSFNLVDDLDHNAEQLYTNVSWQNQPVNNGAKSKYVFPPINE